MMSLISFFSELLSLVNTFILHKFLEQILRSLADKVCSYIKSVVVVTEVLDCPVLCPSVALQCDNFRLITLALDRSGYSSVLGVGAAGHIALVSVYMCSKTVTRTRQAPSLPRAIRGTSCIGALCTARPARSADDWSIHWPVHPYRQSPRANSLNKTNLLFLSKAPFAATEFNTSKWTR